MQKFLIDTNQYFSFQSTVHSHGWSDLLPFKINIDNKYLEYTFNISAAKFIQVKISSDNQNKIIIETQSDLKSKDLITSKIKRIFRLDDNLNEFYEIAEKSEDWRWIIEKGAGRMLCSATVWEDMVKMLCTTNCTWRLTQIMTENLFNILGKSRSFPSASMIAATSEDFLRNEIKMGYRAPYLLQFAQEVASGKLNLKQFEIWNGDSSSLYKEIRKIKGFGDYAVSTLMKLLGRYDFMGFDSWNRKQYFNKHKNGKPCSD